MSELNTFSLSVIVGRLASQLGALITGACGSVLSYQPKNPYVTTPERESLLKSLYNRNCTALESQLRLSGFTSLARDASGHTAKLKAVHTISMFESMSNVEAMRFVAENKHSEAWNKVSSFVGTLKEQLKTPAASIGSLRETTDSCESLLNHMAEDCHSVLANAESALTLKTISESMSSLAYKVKTEGSNLLASRAGISVRAKVENGMVALDTTAFPGISCHAEVHKLEKELEKRGLLVRRLFGYGSNLRDEKARLTNPFPAFAPQEAVQPEPEVRQKQVKPVKQPQASASILTRLAQRPMIRER